MKDLKCRFVVVALACVMIPGSVFAQVTKTPGPAKTPDVADEDDKIAKAAKVETPPRSGFRFDNSIATRTRPIALALLSDTGYRLSLSDSDEDLWKGTHIEGGMYMTLSPATLRIGGYFNFLPIALLNIRGQVQYQNYFGNLGLVFTPPNADQTGEEPRWDLSDFDRSVDEDLGTAAQGLVAQLIVTPRARIADVLVTAEARIQYASLNVDTVYQDIALDLLVDPQDVYMAFRPFLGYMIFQDPADGYVYAGARYENLRAFGSTEASRQAIGGAVVWGIPQTWLGSGRYSISLLTNYIFQDQTDRQGLTVFTIRLRAIFGAG